MANLNKDDYYIDKSFFGYKNLKFNAKYIYLFAKKDENYNFLGLYRFYEAINNKNFWENMHFIDKIPLNKEELIMQVERLEKFYKKWFNQ